MLPCSLFLLSLAAATSVVQTKPTVYDFIVAGGGTAGIIVAERLAETGASVILLERGNASSYASGGQDVLSWNDTVTQYDVPGVRRYIQSSPVYSDKSEYCTDTAGTAGCILGGGTMVNYLMFIRPQKKDFNDNWPAAWRWPRIAAAADRLYARNPGTTLPSVDGRLYDQSSYTVLAGFFKGLGFKATDSIRHPNEKKDFYSHAAYDVADGVHAGPVRSYLPLAMAMPNFSLRLHTSVVRVVRIQAQVTGVEVEDAATGAHSLLNLSKNGKVILATGVFSTPKILFNSGIGPIDQISVVSNSSSTNVTLPPRADWISLPVGKGIKDHVVINLNFNSTAPVTFLPTTKYITPSTRDIHLFNTQSSGIEAQGYQRFNFWTSNTIADGSTRFYQGTCSASATNQVQIRVYLTHGLTSSGSIGINATGNTYYITKPYLTTPGDRTALAAFLDQLLLWARAPNSTLTYVGASNDTGASLVGGVYSTGSHWIGTAKMGADDGRVGNGTSVVDLGCKVYGTDNLYVVDASMHPDLPTGNLQSQVMIVAEAAAARILGEK